ncbi:MAG: endolytic transglycosylase MltG [Myxococcales bacterium]|nr:endolytic transglycosylase MltG [Myxococcales bacterium]
MARKPFRIALIVVASTVALALAIAGFFAYRVYHYPDTRHGGRGEDVAITIKRGMTFPQITKLLAANHVIDHPLYFRIYGMRRGATTAVKPGDYVLRDNLTPREVLDALVAGVRERSVAVTLPEGKHMLEFFQLLEEAGVAKAAELEVLARDPKFLTAHAIAGDTVDGYLFPDTYQFVVPTPPAKVLERLINAHRKAWNAAAREHGKALARLKDRLKWSDRDVLILASIVEKEAVEADERPRIAQVFINRLTSPSFKPKKLETDPTIRYGCLVPVIKSQACKDWLAMCPPDKPGCERLHRAQLVDADNPYNSYQHEGLPPGPICNPGKSSIAAAFDPDGSDYFFFVARDARHHAFSKTVAEHERAVEQYKQWRASGDP